MKLTVIPAVAVLLTSAAAQSPTHLLLGSKLVTLDGGSEVAELAPGLRNDFSRWVGEQRYVVGELSVDAAAGEYLEQKKSTLRLVAADGGERWAVDGVGFAGALPGRRVLAPGRVIVPAKGGGLVALDRDSGDVLWRRPKAPARNLVVDGDMIFAVGMVGEQLTFAGHAMGNGACAFAVPLAVDPDAIVPAAHGVALRTPAGITVFDRAGPKLFELDVAATEIVGGRYWFVRSEARLLAFDRNGKRVWEVEFDPGFRRAGQLAANAAGELLDLRYDRISDSGFVLTCRDPETGAAVWARTDEGLGVSHSKYRHLVHVRPVGDSVFVASQGSGGAFVVEFDAADGAQRSRHVFDR